MRTDWKEKVSLGPYISPFWLVILGITQGTAKNKTQWLAENGDNQGKISKMGGGGGANSYRRKRKSVFGRSPLTQLACHIGHHTVRTAKKLPRGRAENGDHSGNKSKVGRGGYIRMNGGTHLTLLALHIGQNKGCSAKNKSSLCLRHSAGIVRHETNPKVWGEI